MHRACPAAAVLTYLVHDGMAIAYSIQGRISHASIGGVRNRPHPKPPGSPLIRQTLKLRTPHFAELEAAVAAAVAEGGVPFFVGATAGSTVLGAFDPLVDLAKARASCVRGEGLRKHCVMQVCDTCWWTSPRRTPVVSGGGAVQTLCHAGL